MNSLRCFSLLLMLPLLTACPVKNKPRQEHESARTWSPTTTPVDDSVEEKSFQGFDVQSAYAALGDQKSLMSRVLLPLADFVLNGKFIERAEFRTPRMTQMIQIFNTAFLTQLEAGDRSPEFLKLKDQYYKTVFAGCSRDLKTDCYNADLFSADTRHTRIMTRLARELDNGLAAKIKEFETPKKCVELSADCRRLVEERYRLLAMGAYKRNRYDDSEYAFAYLKYARMFGEMLEFSSLRSSYLAETHAHIFDMLIARYQPKDLKDTEFRAFVENFNPWRYSNRSADMFQRGSRVMFGYATRCCLYQDQDKTKLSEAVTTAIAESQKEKKSFRDIVMEIKEAHQGYRLFDNLHIGDLARRIERMDPSFFNEVFFVVDRLYNGHLNTAEVEMVLASANYDRVKNELPKVVAAYLRIQLAYMVLETNRFMAKIYASNIASDRIFQEAVTNSRELSNRWQAIQAQADLLDRMMGSYFKSRFASPEYYETNRLIKAINRNIYYMASYPNMIIMTYFLSKMKGKIVVSSWWGNFEIHAETILDAFFDGTIESPWFRFGKDPEILSRPMLLYSFEYMLSTEALNSFVAKDAADPGGSDRAKFLDLIFTKYLDDNLDELRSQVTAYGRDTWGDARSASMNEICNYETGGRTTPPPVEINFMDLSRYTYAGIGENGAHAVIAGLVTKSGAIAARLRDKTEFRMAFLQVMLDIIEADLMKNGKITQPGQSHPDTARIRANMADIENIRRQLARLFLDGHKKMSSCMMIIREVERRRANRLYEEERAYLGEIYDMMKPLDAAAGDPAGLNAKVAELNATLAKKARQGDTAYLPADLPYDFDKIDGLTFKLSKYNLLMRMKKRVESDLFFSQPTETEKRVYGEAQLKQLLRPRPVTVYRPDGLVRDEMVSKGLGITLYLRGTREDFIRQGMIALNGKSLSYIEWRAQAAAVNSPAQYFKSLIEFYLLGPINKGDGTFWQVTKEDLVSAYIQALAADTMDDFDLTNSRDFGVDGLQNKSHFEGKLFEKDFITRLPLFYELMKEVYAYATIHLETGPVEEALNFAQQINNLQMFVFQPSGTIPESVSKIYGDRVHQRMNRVQELYDYLARLETEKSDALAFDPRLDRPFYLEGDTGMSWYSPRDKNLVDSQKRNDLKALVKDFTTRTNNFYKTREKVKTQ